MVNNQLQQQSSHNQYSLYIKAFLRRLKPEMFNEPCDIICSLTDKKGAYKPNHETYRLYKVSSYGSSVSSLLGGLNRLAIKLYNDAINACTTDQARNSIERPNIVNINDAEWISVKMIREKVSKVLFARQFVKHLYRENKETNSLSIELICAMFQNLGALTHDMLPIVCPFYRYPLYA